MSLNVKNRDWQPISTPFEPAGYAGEINLLDPDDSYFDGNTAVKLPYDSNLDVSGGLP
ncbi:MAG: hypothetical protein LBH00_06090 [Planctomycetaceae bacterium]|jgi:hypothetical protein|nr:hypothetical protein [Planctomycetaceae bacterium]